MNPPAPFRLILTHAQAAEIRAAGIVFAAGAPCDFNAKAAPSIHLVPCSKATADAAVSVAMGTHRAAKIPAPKS
jgi:hypothetical protein